MRRILRPLLLLGGAAGLTYAAYRTLLNDRARADLADCARSVRASWERVSDAVGLGSEDVEAGREAARRAAREQWERLGY